MVSFRHTHVCRRGADILERLGVVEYPNVEVWTEELHRYCRTAKGAPENHPRSWTDPPDARGRAGKSTRPASITMKTQTACARYEPTIGH